MLLLTLLFGLVLACGLLTTIETHWQQGILSGAIVWGIAIVLITEGLGQWGDFSREAVALSWLGLDLALAAGWLYRTRRLPLRKLPLLPQLYVPGEFGGIALLLLGLVVSIAVLTGITALVAPPNNWDSMTYHMSRVMHWLQNGRLDHYPTHYTPQLYHPPWAEIAIAHLQILSGGDRWANGIQWLSLVGSGIGVAAIARELGASARGQLFATAFACTLPMGLLQAATTQNDYTVCFWTVCLAQGVVKIHTDRLTVPLILKVSASLGLALLTKTSAYFFAIPFLIWLSVSTVCQRGWTSWQPALILIGSVLAINAGHFFRNWEMFGSPITGGPEELAIQYRMEHQSIATLLSNLVRNAAFHLSTPFPWLNAKLNGAITGFHRLIGIDPSDPRTTIPGGKFGVFQISFKEDLAGNTAHFLTALASIGSLIGLSSLRRHRLIWIYLLCVIGAYAILCWMLKWQPFNSRHHLTLFVLIAPFVGWVLSKFRWQRWTESFVLMLAIAALPWIFNAQFRPWFGEQSIFVVPRVEQYFIQRDWLKNQYLAAANFVQSTNCNQIGFSFEDDPTGRIWEYPFWVLLENTNGKTKTMQHLRADNVSKLKLQQEPYKSYQPCAVITVDKTNKENSTVINSTVVNPTVANPAIANPMLESKGHLETLAIAHRSYHLSWKQPPVTVYLADDSVPGSPNLGSSN
jgi:hypothetical protein